MRPNVGRKPARPQRAAGLRIDPLVSEPMPNATQPGRGRGRGAGRRSARALRRIPRALGLPAKPVVAARQLAGRDLRDQHRAGIAQLLDHGRVVIEHLFLERRRSPRRLDSP